jgi:hypothetical protein
MTSAHRQTLERVLDDITPEALREIAAISWEVVCRHPVDASCECLVLDVLVAFYQRGYVLVQEQGKQEA